MHSFSCGTPTPEPASSRPWIHRNPGNSFVIRMADALGNVPPVDRHRARKSAPSSELHKLRHAEEMMAKLAPPSAAQTQALEDAFDNFVQAALEGGQLE